MSTDSGIKDLKRHFNSSSRKAFLVYVDLDPVPGTFSTPYSAYLNIQGIFENSIPHYNPTVILVSTYPHKSKDSGQNRVCFAVYVNLDPVPGAFHSQESAQNILREMLRQRIGHYNPMVSLAPDSIQPTNIAGEIGL